MTLPATIAKLPIPPSLRGDAFQEYQLIGFGVGAFPPAMVAEVSAVGDFSGGRRVAKGPVKGRSVVLIPLKNPHSPGAVVRGEAFLAVVECLHEDARSIHPRRMMRLAVDALPTRGPVCPKCGVCIPQLKKG